MLISRERLTPLAEIQPWGHNKSDTTERLHFSFTWFQVAVIMKSAVVWTNRGLFFSHNKSPGGRQVCSAAQSCQTSISAIMFGFPHAHRGLPQLQTSHPCSRLDITICLLLPQHPAPRARSCLDRSQLRENRSSCFCAVNNSGL